MTTAEIILQVRKKIPFLLLATAITFGLAYSVFSRAFVTFRSESTFYINENVILNAGMGQIEPNELNVLSTIATNKVLLLMGSDELRDSIIKDFNLYKHYNINPNDEFAHEKVLLALSNRLSVRRELTSASLLHLTVDDADRFVAAGIANKMVERVNLMNKEILAHDLQRRIQKYESLLPTLKDKVEDNQKNFVGFMDSVAPGISNQDPGTLEIPRRYKLVASDLAGKMDKSATKYEDMLSQYHDLMSTVKTISDDEWQCITTVKKAMPDIKSWRNTVIEYSAGASLAALFCYISLMVYFYQNDDQMHLLKLALKGRPKAK